MISMDVVSSDIDENTALDIIEANRQVNIDSVLYLAGIAKGPNIAAKRNKKNTKHIKYKGLKWCLSDKVKVGGQIGFITGFTGNMVYVQDTEGRGTEPV